MMEEKYLDIALNCHVIYSDACKKIIQEKVAIHYPEDKEEIWQQIQQQYVDYLKKWRTDLGGKRNYHNAQGGTYDSIAMMCYWVVCKEKTDIKEVEEMMNSQFLPSFSKLSFVDINKPFWKKILYYSFKVAAKKCSKWPDYDMRVAPYKKDEPIYYEFKTCPIADFARELSLQEVMLQYVIQIMLAWLICQQILLKKVIVAVMINVTIQFVEIKMSYVKNILDM